MKGMAFCLKCPVTHVSLLAIKSFEKSELCILGMVTNRRRSASPHSQQVERNATFNVVYASF
jgi:hypothetical protein